MYLPKCNCLSYIQLFKWYVFNRSGPCHVTGGDVKGSSRREHGAVSTNAPLWATGPSSRCNGQWTPNYSWKAESLHTSLSTSLHHRTGSSACPGFSTQDTLLLRSSGKYHYMRENSFCSRSFPR